MTCHQIQSLIDDYIDGELSDATKIAVESHAGQCPDCARELHLASGLKESLIRMSVSDPGPQYFEETRNIILARTVEATSEQASDSSISARSEHERSSFIRSLISVAASIGIFLTALSIGSHKEALSGATTNQSTQTVSLVSMVSSPLEIPISIQEREKILGGTLMIGAPGLIGRFAGFSDFRGADQ